MVVNYYHHLQSIRSIPGQLHRLGRCFPLREWRQMLSVVRRPLLLAATVGCLSKVQMSTVTAAAEHPYYCQLTDHSGVALQAVNHPLVQQLWVSQQQQSAAAAAALHFLSAV
jgi:hypothetical protein